MNKRDVAMGCAFAAMQHYEDMDKVAKDIATLLRQGIDIDDAIFNSLIRKYGLDKDGFIIDVDYIIKEAKRRV